MEDREKGKTTLEDNVFIDPNLVSKYINHTFKEIKKSIKSRILEKVIIIIRNKLSICRNYFILTNFRIIKGVTIAARVDVTEDVVDNCIVYVIPAKFIKKGVR